MIRLTTVRQGVQLLQPSIRLQSSDIMGVCEHDRLQAPFLSGLCSSHRRCTMADADLPMKGIQAGHCWVPHTCLTIRHVIDRDSPLHSSNRGKEGICKSRPQEQRGSPTDSARLQVLSPAQSPPPTRSAAHRSTLLSPT